jgi:GT2 family glycosyltransferase
MAERFVTGIVVNYKTMKLTERAVSSLLGEPEMQEVIVVDNNSQDGSVEFLTETLPADRVRVLRSESNLGFGQGVNLGADAGSGSMLFLLNSDAELVAGGIARLSDALAKEPHTAIAAPLIVDSGGSAQLDAQGVFPSLRTMVVRTNRRPPDRLHPDWVSGAAMLIRRDAFREVGGFDPAFWMYFEDVDLCRRLRLRSWDVVRVPEARVLHAKGASSDSNERDELYHESLVLLLRKSGAPRIEVAAVAAAHRLWRGVRKSR